jgi:hypothetical protein
MIRDILNTLDVLTESTGLANRKPGDVFRNPDGEEITFTGVQFFPDGGGKYTKEELDQAIDQVTDGLDVQWMNTQSGKSGGFAIASFTSPTKEVYFGRFLEQIKPNHTDNKMPNKVGDFTLASKSASKIQARLTPQDLLSIKNDLTAQDIIEELRASLGEDHALVALAVRVANGEQFPLHFSPPADLSFEAFRDYFCEILQPIALQTGNFKGNAGEAAEIFMDGSFADTLISFDDSKNAGLSDSILTNDSGKIIKISTKGGVGAEASTKNLLDSVEELKLTTTGKKLIRKYQEVITLLGEIKTSGQHEAPIMLSVKYDIINEKEAEQVRSLRNTSPVDLDNLDDVSISARLKKIAKTGDTRTPNNTNLYYHILKELAKKAADKVNEETNFSKAAADILNNGALVQVYTKAKQGKDTWILQEFMTVFPGDSIKGVYLTSRKGYFSTGIKGNFTFKIDKGQGIEKDKDAERQSNDTPPKEKELSLSKAAEKITTGRPSATKKDAPKPKVGDVGRAKRK